MSKALYKTKRFEESKALVFKVQKDTKASLKLKAGLFCEIQDYINGSEWLLECNEVHYRAMAYRYRNEHDDGIREIINLLDKYA